MRWFFSKEPIELEVGKIYHTGEGFYNWGIVEVLEILGNNAYVLTHDDCKCWIPKKSRHHELAGPNDIDFFNKQKEFFKNKNAIEQKHGGNT